ncbi:MAG: hypothetical protein WAJ92_02450 [Candidatus Acidiferrales bacterium]
MAKKGKILATRGAISEREFEELLRRSSAILKPQKARLLKVARFDRTVVSLIL